MLIPASPRRAQPRPRSPSRAGVPRAARRPRAFTRLDLAVAVPSVSIVRSCSTRAPERGCPRPSSSSRSRFHDVHLRLSREAVRADGDRVGADRQQSSTGPTGSWRRRGCRARHMTSAPPITLMLSARRTVPESVPVGPFGAAVTAASASSFPSPHVLLPRSCRAGTGHVDRVCVDTASVAGMLPRKLG